MKKCLFLLLSCVCCLSMSMAQEAHFFLKNGTRLTLPLVGVDSITYLNPEAEVSLPAACQVEVGESVKFTYTTSDGVEEEPIQWSSTDWRIAEVYDGQLHGYAPGKCVICATYKGVTSSCEVTVVPSFAQEVRVLLYCAPLVCYSSAELGAYMAQALTTGGRTQTGSYRSGWEFVGEVCPHWDFYCTTLAPMAVRLNKLSEEHGYRNIALITRTIMLMATMLTTDIYGDMPREEAGKAFVPKFDTQEDIYAWMFREVDDLLALYNDPSWVGCATNLAMDKQIEPLYGGDLSKWEGFCKALKARLWLRKLPNWENTSSTCSTIINLVNDVLATWTEPLYVHTGEVVAVNGGMRLARDYNSWGMSLGAFGWTNPNQLSLSVPTTFFLHGLMGSIDGTYQTTRGYALDPRAEKMMLPRNNYYCMFHLESNIGMGIGHVLSDYPDLQTQSTRTNPYTLSTGYTALMTTEELMFIKAEAQYWSGDVNGAYNTTVEATKANMARYGIVESNLEDLSLDYTGGARDQYHRFFNIKLPGSSTFTIADLMQQKYVAMYLQPEQWTDMRRYNYSSSTNGIAYALPGQAPVYVYDVKNVHNGKNVLFAKDSANFCLNYSLRRPFNLYEKYWWTTEDFGANAKLSPNAWLMRVVPAVTDKNLDELKRLGDMKGDEIDPTIMRKRMIWSRNTSDVAVSVDPNIVWK